MAVSARRGAALLRRFALATAFWLGLLESLAAAAGWWGATWGIKRLWTLPALALPGLARRLWRAGPAALTALILALPPALALQVTLANRRNRRLNPLLQLRPGVYADRTIARLDVPSATGPIPALHITPRRDTHAAVCIAHGSSCDKTFYVWRLADRLIARGYAVLLIDLDGHGENPRSQDFPAILHNIADAVAWLRERSPRVGVIGISLGGCVAVRAVADGVTVDALAVLEAPTQLNLTRRYIRRVVIPLEAARLLRPSVLQLLRDGSIAHVIGAWRTSGLRATIGTWDLFTALDLLGSLRRIGARGAGPPLLLIYGGSDAIVLPAEAERVRQAMPADATFHLLPGASHISLPIEPRTHRLVLEWLDTRLRRPGGASRPHPARV